MAANAFTPLINGNSQLHLQSQSELQPQNEKSTARLLTRRALAVACTFFGVAMLMFILLSSSSSSTSNSSSNNNSGAIAIRSNVSISVGPSSSLRAAAAAAAAAIVSSDEGKMGSCRTTGSTIPYIGGHQTFGEPLYDLDFRARSYANRAWQDKKYFDTFDEAWQACAIQCNNEHKCHTYTAQFHNADLDYCYLHDPYKSGYKLHKNEWPSSTQFLSYVSGVCRLNNE